MFGIILPLVAFYIFVSIFSDGAESQARWKIFAIAVAATLLISGFSRSMPTVLGLGAGLFLATVISFLGLAFWVRVTRLQALEITGSYLGFVIGYSLLVQLLFGHHAA